MKKQLIALNLIALNAVLVLLLGVLMAICLALRERDYSQREAVQKETIETAEGENGTEISTIETEETTTNTNAAEDTIVRNETTEFLETKNPESTIEETTPLQVKDTTETATSVSIPENRAEDNWYVGGETPED